MAIAYLTDVEGMWSRVVSFARDNPCVTLEGDTLQLEPGATLVFGGDAIDRGPHGRRILRALIDAKRRWPDRVVLLAGNRDLNKLRLLRELCGEPPQRMPDDVKAASRPELLRWIFSNTMGAGQAFEHRRTELHGADDEQIVDSFLEDVRPGGLLRSYLDLAQLGHRFGDVLFVHGGVTADNLWLTPGQPRAHSTDEWVATLNGWYRQRLASAESGARGPDGRPLWAELMAYQAPLPGTKLNQASVVYGRTADELNNPVLPQRSVREALLDDGVRRLVVGHTPNGDSPSVLRDDVFELYIADNSRSRVEEGSQLILHEERTTASGTTVLDDGRSVRVLLEVRRGQATPLGLRVARTGELVKGVLESGDYLLFRYLPRFEVRQTAWPAHRLDTETLEPPEPQG